MFSPSQFGPIPGSAGTPSSQSNETGRLKEELRRVNEENEVMKEALASAIREGHAREALNLDEPKQDYLDHLNEKYQEIENLHRAYGKILRSREDLENKREAELHDIEAELRRTNVLLVSRNTELRDVKTKLQRTEELLETKHAKLRHVETRLEQAEERSVVRNAELQDIKTSLAEMKELSAARNAELHQFKIKLRQDFLAARVAEHGSLQTFPKTDSISSAQLKQMVDDLNDEIFQLASAIVEYMEGKVRRLSGIPTVQKSQNRLIDGGTISKEFVQAFLDDTFLSPADMSMAFQISLEACMSDICQRIARSISWDTGKQLIRVLGAIRDTESYPVYARRRAMIHKQWAGPENQNLWEDLMESTLLDVLNVCGYRNLQRACVNENKTRIRRLVEMALKLNYTIMQEALSLEVVAFGFPTQSLFISSHMRDENERANFKIHVPPNTPIIATTSMGLALRRVKVDSQDRNEQFDKWVMAIKAAVALPGSIQYKEGSSTVANTTD